MPLTYNSSKIFFLKSSTADNMLSFYFMEADSGSTLRMDVPVQKVSKDFFQ